MAGNNTIHLTDDNFEQEVLKSDAPVLVDFSATWCGPCQLLAPIIDELADEYVGKVKIGKIDTEEAQRTAAKYGVMQIPTVILFESGQPTERLLGAKPKSVYKTILDGRITVG